MKERFMSYTFHKKSLDYIAACNKIIDDYLAQGMRLTLRQLYYQLVTQNLLTNCERSYSYLSTVVSRGRLAGLLDWNAIEDRTRMPKEQNEFENVAELVEAAIRTYRLPRWKGQDYYVELWVEKDALAGVLLPMARRFHVTVMVNKGYSSQTAMHESSLRFMATGRSPLLLYLGDHDPSGEDMVRDIRDRMEMFGVDGLEVQKLALTMEQVEEYKLPPNPAKISDSRAAAYIEKHGNESWEVDALPPTVLHEIIIKAFEEVVDSDKMAEIIDQEYSDMKKLRKAVRS